MRGRKSSVDWARIEAEYLAGEDSIREIADRHGISDTAIRKRAKASGWVRAVRGCEPANRVPAQAPVRDGKDATARGRELVERMLDELDAVTSHFGDLEAEILSESSAKRQTAMFRAIGLGGRAATLKTLAQAYKTLGEAGAPQGKKAATQDRAQAIASRLRGVGPPTLKAVK